jgi:hypothetical protein
MMYIPGDYVRLESSNELKVIVRVVPIENKVFYVCNDNIWYDEESLYPYKMKIDIKESLGEDLTLSDFGKEDVVLSSLVDYLTYKENSDKLEKFIKDLTEDMEIDMDMW